MTTPITMEKTAPPRRNGYPGWALALAFVFGAMTTVLLLAACADPIEHAPVPSVRSG